MLPAAAKKYRFTWGILIAGALIVYFLLMRLFNLHYIFELRYFNVVILFTGEWLAYRRLKKISPELNYFDGLAYGMTIVFVAAFVFCVFMTIYLFGIDPAFLRFIKQNTINGINLDIFMLIVLLFSEAVSSGAIITFMLMQFYKDNSVTEDQK